MTDFSESLKKGIEAARVAVRNRAEVIAVFEDLNSQLAKETDGKLEVLIGPANARTLPDKLVSMIAPKFSELTIKARNPKNARAESVELAGWSQDRSGYPCRITIGLVKQASYEDKESLEKGLAELLEDPIVGEILYGLMKLEADVHPS